MDSHLMTLQIRKLRKKLRQIENLESLERDLTDEEIDKCLKKDNIRDELLFLLSQVSDEQTPSSKIYVDEDFNSSCSVSTDWSVSTNTSKTVSETDITVTVNQSDINKDEIRLESNPSSKAELTNKEEKIHGSESSDQVTQSTGMQSQKAQSKLTKEDKVAEKDSNLQPSPSKKNKSNISNKGNLKVQNSKSVFWNNSGFIVDVLEGHSDLVTAVDCKGPLFISASRDTTIKVWDFKTLTEQKSLGSHTGSVTDVILLSSQELGPLGPKLELSDEDFAVLSGSVDCSLKLWSAKTGELLKSIYTYNPITKVAYHPALACIVTASDGGKLELWDLETKENIISHKAHDESVTGLVVKDEKIFTSCATEGEIKVFEVREKQLFCVFASENVHLLDGKPTMLRHVRSLAVFGDNVYYGDDGVNLKSLSWKKGYVKKLRNHKEDFGMTDAISVYGETMITSAFDLDTGCGYLNVFDIAREPLYLTTINIEDCGRILDIACDGEKNYVTIVTAGTELQVWRQVPKSGDNPDLIQTKFEQTLSQAAVDSDLESDVEFSDSDSETGRPGSRRGSAQSSAKSSWTSWCTLL